MTFLVIISFMFYYPHDKYVNFSVTKGTYRFQLWGANGGNSSQNAKGGNGAYVSAVITFLESTELFATVGGSAQGFKKGELRGGKGSDCGTRYTGGGGGSTEVGFDQLSKSRFIVAAGGSGAADDFDGYPGDAIRINDEGGDEGFGFISPDLCECDFLLSGGGGGFRGGYSRSPDLFKCTENKSLLVSDPGSSFIYGHPNATGTHKINGIDKIKIHMHYSEAINGKDAPNLPNGTKPTNGVLIVDPFYKEDSEDCLQSGEQYRPNIFKRAANAVRRLKPGRF